MGIPVGLMYYVESGLVAVLLVEIVNAVCGLLLVMAGLFPRGISRMGIPIEKGSRFGAFVAVLVIIMLVATALQPEPPGGWWTYGLDSEQGGAQWAVGLSVYLCPRNWKAMSTDFYRILSSWCTTRVLCQIGWR